MQMEGPGGEDSNTWWRGCQGVTAVPGVLLSSECMLKADLTRLEKYVLASHSPRPLSRQPVRAWLDAGSHKYIYHRKGEQGHAPSSRVAAGTAPAKAALLLRLEGSWLPRCAVGCLTWSSVVCLTLVQSLFVCSLCAIQVSRQLAAHHLICLDASSLERPASTYRCSF